MIVNQAFARAIWGPEDVVGEPFSIGIVPGNALSGRTWAVVGVLEDLSYGHPSAAPEPYAFRGDLSLGSAIVESDLKAAALQQALDGIDSDLDQVNVVRSLKTMRSELIAPDRARGFLTIATATLVVLLAAFGLYGTQRYLVAAGRREYAIRGSLGAGPRALGWLVLRRGLVLGLPGIALGALLGYVEVNWLQDAYLTRDISSGPVTVAVVIGLMVLILIACLGPVREARTTRPAPLLREE